VKNKPCPFDGLVDGCHGTFKPASPNQRTCKNPACVKALRRRSGNKANRRYKKNHPDKTKAYMTGPTGYNRRWYVAKHPDATVRDTPEHHAKISAGMKAWWAKHKKKS
jgi:hypothetical protein